MRAKARQPEPNRANRRLPAARKATAPRAASARLAGPTAHRAALTNHAPAAPGAVRSRCAAGVGGQNLVHRPGAPLPRIIVIDDDDPALVDQRQQHPNCGARALVPVAVEPKQRDPAGAVQRLHRCGQRITEPTWHDRRLRLRQAESGTQGSDRLEGGGKGTRRAVHQAKGRLSVPIIWPWEAFETVKHPHRGTHLAEGSTLREGHGETRSPHPGAAFDDHSATLARAHRLLRCESYARRRHHGVRGDTAQKAEQAEGGERPPHTDRGIGRLAQETEGRGVVHKGTGAGRLLHERSQRLRRPGHGLRLRLTPARA